MLLLPSFEIASTHCDHDDGKDMERTRSSDQTRGIQLRPRVLLFSDNDGDDEGIASFYPSPPYDIREFELTSDDLFYQPRANVNSRVQDQGCKINDTDSGVQSDSGSLDAFPATPPLTGISSSNGSDDDDSSLAHYCVESRARDELVQQFGADTTCPPRWMRKSRAFSTNQRVSAEDMDALIAMRDAARYEEDLVSRGLGFVCSTGAQCPPTPPGGCEPRLEEYFGGRLDSDDEDEDGDEDEKMYDADVEDEDEMDHCG